MSLVDIFRPKWKHSDSAVRATAVKAMGPDDATLLARIAQSDPDERVREIAIKRIEDPETLIALARDALGASLADLAVQRASSLLVNDAVQGDDQSLAEEALERIEDSAALVDVARRASFAEVRTGALDRIDDERALADVARLSKREDVRLAAVERIGDQSVLRSLCLDGQHRGVALAALTRLEDEEALEDVAKHAKVKSVRGRAQKRLAASQPDAPDDAERREAERVVAREKRRNARRQTKGGKLCDRLEKLLHAAREPETEGRLAEIEARWRELSDDGPLDEKLVARFEAAQTELRARLSAIAEERAAEAARQAEVSGAVEQREELIAAVEALALDAGDSEAEEIESRWDWLPDFEADEAAPLERRFRGALRKWRARKANRASREQIRPELEQLLASAEEAVKQEKLGLAKKGFREVSKQWKTLAGRGGGDDDLEARFKELKQILDERDAADRAERDQRREEELARITDLLDSMEQMKETDHLPAADQLLREAREAAKKASSAIGRKAWGELRGRYKEAEQALARRVGELREADDWNRHFNLRKQQELCEKVEALVASDDPQAALKELRQAQTDWKKVARGPRGRSGDLWQRFKKAGDAVYAKSGEFLEGQKKEREENLKLKEGICEQAEALSESTEWQETTDKLKALQAEWKAIGPAPRKKSDAVWKRFRKACDVFFERRKVHYKELEGQRKENLARKIAICERAEELQHSSDWDETANALKGLQSEWKSIGPVPRNQSDAIWERFRGACDNFFDRREAHLDGGKRANLAQRVALCEELEAALDGVGDDTDRAALAAQVLEAWQGWSEIAPIPFDEVERTDARMAAICERAVAAFAESFAGTSLDPEVAERRRVRLCERAEALGEREQGVATEGEEYPAEEKTVAERLQEAMEQNAFPEESKATGKRQVEDEVEQLRTSWRAAPPVPGERGRELTERFEAAIASIPALEDKKPS